MSRKSSVPDEQNVLQDAWEHVVGGMSWLNSVVLGEFADHRPLSAIVADMLISFVPGVIIVTSARDAVAVVLRMASHPEKREDLMEWVLLSACLIVLALPIAMAAGGAVVAGAGAIVGGIAGSELGAALRAVMLMLIKEATKLAELVHFLQKFMKGDVFKFLRNIHFVEYEKALIQIMRQIIDSLVRIVKSLRQHLESLRHLDTVKTTISKLVEWEAKFYKVQQDALKQMPKALAELDARLAKLIADTAPKEIHTVAAGVKTDTTTSSLPAKQRVHDTPGKAINEVEIKAPAIPPAVKAKTKAQTGRPPKIKAKAAHKPPPKAKPDPVKPPHVGANAKKLTAADAAVAADRAAITRLSDKAREATKNGDNALAAAKIKEARDILSPYLPKNPGDNWDEIVKRLDVSSPKDGAVFWSGTSSQAEKLGQADAALVLAEKIGGVTLETTSGGRIIDKWDDVNKNFPWNSDAGPPPWASDLWKQVSEKYANSATGNINLVQTPDRLWSPATIWHSQEKPTLLYLQKMGQIDNITVHVVDAESATHKLSQKYTEQLLKFDQRP